MTIGEKASEYAEKCFPSDDISKRSHSCRRGVFKLSHLTIYKEGAAFP